MKTLWERFLLWLSEDVDDAWQEGFRAASDECDETVAEKDEFIEKQGRIIVELMDVLSRAEAWEHVSGDLFEDLRDYA